MSTPSAVWVKILLALLRDTGGQVSIKLCFLYICLRRLLNTDTAQCQALFRNQMGKVGRKVGWVGREEAEWSG